MPQNRVFGPVLAIFSLKMPFYTAFCHFGREGDNMAARCARGDVGAPRRRANAKTRCHAACGAAGAPLFPGPLPFGPRVPWVLFKRGGEAGGCGFPRLGFPPGAPLSEAPPFHCGSSAGGQTHPRSLALARSLGATARRPVAFIIAAALRVPPPENPRRSLNTPGSLAFQAGGGLSAIGGRWRGKFVEEGGKGEAENQEHKAD